MDLAERIKQKLAEQKAEVKSEINLEKPVVRLNLTTKKKSKKSNKLEKQSYRKMDIDEVSYHYTLNTNKKRIHKKNSITTKNYMINEIIKALESNKTTER